MEPVNTLLGGLGNDRVDGQGGDDTINGNFGNDGDGNDFIRGGDGNDRLFGENGDDRLFGEGGNDGLIGGSGGSDFLSGGEDDDRVLVIGDDTFSDRTPNDAQIDFRNGSAVWTNVELRVLDDSFQRLHDVIGNARLLRDPITNQPLVFIKNDTIPVGTHMSQSELVTVTTQSRDPDTGEVVSNTILERQYTLAEWDESIAAENTFRVLELPQDIALAWASEEAITNVLPSEITLWNQFLLLTDWIPVVNEDGSRNSNPDPEFYQISTDNQWFHLQAGLFAEELVMENPQEDFASIWRLIFEEGREDEKVFLTSKVSFVEDLFSRLEIF